LKSNKNIYLLGVKQKIKIKTRKTATGHVFRVDFALQQHVSNISWHRFYDHG